MLSFLNGFAGTSAVSAASHGGVTGSVLNSTTNTTSGLNSWLNSSVPTPPNKPKAYINWILFDEQFKPVTTGSGSGFDGVDIADQIKPHVNNVNISKNGYLYVYCSNESNQDVFFDNLQVTHTKGPLVEETHYYPFGLTMAGISSKAAGGIENKLKYNGNKLENGEFSDGSGLDIYDFNARTYDQQIERFIQIDPELEDGQDSWTPYHFGFNNPVLYNDPDGRNPVYPIVRALRYAAMFVKWTQTLGKVGPLAPASIIRDASAAKSLIPITLKSEKKEETAAPKTADKPVEIVIDAKKHPESAQNLQEAIDEGKKNEGVIDRKNVKNNRKENLKDTKTEAKKDRDEAPPAVINTGEKAKVKLIDPSDNRGAGGSIGQQIRNLPDGTKVVIVPKY